MMPALRRAGRARRRACASGRELLLRGWASPIAASTGRPSSRAASSSAWPSRARWPWSPPLVLADEPTGNLDTADRRRGLRAAARDQPRAGDGLPRRDARPAARRPLRPHHRARRRTDSRRDRSNSLVRRPEPGAPGSYMSGRHVWHELEAVMDRGRRSPPLRRSMKKNVPNRASARAPRAVVTSGWSKRPRGTRLRLRGGDRLPIDLEKRAGPVGEGAKRRGRGTLPRSGGWGRSPVGGTGNYGQGV